MGVFFFEDNATAELFFLYLFACLSGVQVADVVLSCSFIEEGGGMTGSHFIRSPATVVLRDLPMSADLSAEAITPYVHPDTPNADDLIFEATSKLKYHIVHSLLLLNVIYFVICFLSIYTVALSFG